MSVSTYDVRMRLRQRIAQYLIEMPAESAPTSPRGHELVVDVSTLHLAPTSEEFIARALELFGEIDVLFIEHVRRAYQSNMPKRAIVSALADEIHKADRFRRKVVGAWTQTNLAQLKLMTGRRFVDELYRSLLWQDPTPAQAAQMLEALQSGAEKATLIRQVALLPAARANPKPIPDIVDAKHIGSAPTDAGFVVLLYTSFVRRSPSAIEADHIINALNSTYSRDDIMRLFRLETAARFPDRLVLGLDDSNTRELTA